MASFLFLDYVLFIASIYFLQRLVSKRHAPLPPGPRGYPLIGNIFDMPTDRPWLTFSSWAEIWGRLWFFPPFCTILTRRDR